MAYLDTTLGAAFIGNVIASSLYGIACTEEYTYFFKGRAKDPVYLRLLLIVVWLSDTIQIAFSTHALYYYMVINYDNTLALLYPTWSLLSQIFATSISGIIVRGIFTRRVFIITNRNYGVLGIISLASLSAFGCGFAYAIKGFHIGTFFDLQHISFVLYLAFASAVTADVLIATSLCYSLSKRRTGFKMTDSLVKVLIFYAVNSSLLTSLCSIACLITYALWPTQFKFIAVFFLQSKLYTISLFVTLNSREHLRERIAAPDDVSLSISLPGRPIAFASADVEEDGEVVGQSVMVTIERKVQYEEKVDL